MKEGNLCWRCARIIECDDDFPNGRPEEKGDCDRYVAARISIAEIAKILRRPERTIARWETESIIKNLEQIGVHVRCVHEKNRTIFFRKGEKQ